MRVKSYTTLFASVALAGLLCTPQLHAQQEPPKAVADEAAPDAAEPGALPEVSTSVLLAVSAAQKALPKTAVAEVEGVAEETPAPDAANAPAAVDAESAVSPEASVAEAEAPDTSEPAATDVVAATPEAAATDDTDSAALESTETLDAGALADAPVDPANVKDANDELPAVDPETAPLPSVEELVGMQKLDQAVQASADAAEAASEVPDPEVEARRAEIQAFLAESEALFQTVRTESEAIDIFGRLSRFTEPSREGLFVLRPYVDDPRWMKAMAALEDDDCGDALKTLGELFGEEGPSSDAEPAIRYAYARVQLCAGKRDEGRKTLKELAAEKTAIGHLARVRLGMKSKSGKDVKHREGWYLSQKLNLAKRKGRKDLDAALADLDKLHGEMTSNWDKYRVRLTQAEILEAGGKIDRAGQAYLEIYRRTRGWKVNSSIEDRIERLERRHKKKFLTYGERIDRMRHLIARGRYKQAKKLSIANAKLRGVKGNEVRGWARYRQALQYEREKKRSKAIELFASADKLVRDAEVRPRLYFGWARALRRVDRDREAIALYEKLCKEFGEHHLCDDATYEAGRLLQFLEDHGAAQAKFEKVIKDYPESEFIADALWRSAFSFYLTGDFEKAIPRLEKLRQEHGSLQDASELTLGLKATYWLAVSQLKAGKKLEARQTLQETIDRGTLTWYGRLAVARMKDEGWRPRVDMPKIRLTREDLEDLSKLRVAQNDRLSVAAELVRMGLWEDALGELKDQVAIHPVPEGAHQMLAAVHLARGNASWAHWTMKKQIEESGPTYETMRDWGTAFPLNYMELAHEYGTKYKVSPFLVQAIIRQESGFRPTVKSWAGAVGLMQMMPRTARWTTKKFMQEQRFRRSQLLKPETNVKLGSMYIRVHTAHTNESIPLALAGYNAGAGALESWFERYGDRELDAFVESITYQEARGYVRKVFTSYIVYSALYSGELPDLSLQLPKDLRKWGVVPEVQTPVSLLDGEVLKVAFNDLEL